MGTFLQTSILIVIFQVYIVLLISPFLSAQQPEFSHNTIRNGGSNGGVLLTLKGRGFAKNQFNFGSGNEHLGNKVVLASDTKSLPCDIHPDGNTETMITCYTRPLPRGRYSIRISVDGEIIPDANMCRGRVNSGQCSHYVWDHYTPIINELSPISGPPGSMVKMTGRMFTTRYGSNLGPASNGRSESILRIYSGGNTCELKDIKNDTFYGIALTNYDWGYMKCKLQGSFVGSFNISYLISGSFGRSLPKSDLLKVSRAGKIYLFQTYAEILSVYPKEGSIMGGTLMTIKGRNFDETAVNARVFVGDTICLIVKPVTKDTIVCRVAPKPATLPTLHAGNRGLQMEYWTSDVGNNIYKVLALNSTSPTYNKTWIDKGEFHASGEYGAQIQALFQPMYNGIHAFSATSNGYRQIRLSSNESKDHVKLIGNVHRVYLNESKRYYMEIAYVNSNYKNNDLFRLQIFSFNSSVNNRETGLAQNSRQQFSLWVKTVREIQVIKLENLPENAPVDEIQELSISKPVHVGEDAMFKLIFGDTATVPLSSKATPLEVQKALEGLPMIGTGNVAVTANFTVNSVIYFILLKLDVGNLPLIGVEPIPDTNGNNLIVRVDTNFNGTASNKRFAFYLDNVMSPIIPIDASAQMVKNAIDEMFSVRCQQFITTPDKNSIFRNDFELPSDSSHNGLKIYHRMPFCGKGAVQNPQYIFFKGQIKQAVYLENYPTMCAAFRGDANIELVVNYISRTPSDKSAQKKTKIISTYLTYIDDWKYICFDILKAVKDSGAVAHLLEAINIKRISAKDDIYMDSIILTKISQQDESLVLTQAMVRQLPPLSNRLVVKEMQVNKLGQSMYEVTLESYNCTVNIPLFQTLPDTLTLDRNESVTSVPGDQLPAGVWRLQAASPPLGGSFKLQYDNEQSADIPVWASKKEVEYYLAAMPTMGTMKVDIEGNCTCNKYTIEWLSNPGNKPLLSIITSNITGMNVSSSIKITRYGGYNMRPVPGEHFRTIHTKPQVTAFINDISTALAPGADASFEWKMESTPFITDVNPSQGSVPINLTISGSRFNNTVISSNNVTIDNQDCKIISVSTTRIVCTLSSCSMGVHDVIIVVDDKGTALANVNPVQFTGTAKVLSVNPEQGSYEGGTHLTIKGYGFRREMVVKMDDDYCENTAITSSEIKCITPPQKDSSQIRQVQVKINNQTNVEGVADFTYTAPIGNVTQVNISMAKVTGGEPILLTGTNLDSSSHLEIGHVPANILSANSTNVLAIMPAQEPGVHDIQLTISNGYAAISGPVKSIDQTLFVSSVTPDQGSLLGGTRLTITGKGFDVRRDQIKITAGLVPCNVENFSNSWIMCRLEHTVKTYHVINPGIHPEYEKDANEELQTMDLKVGDSVQWSWSVPIWLRSVHFHVFQIDNPFSGQAVQNGFKSGNKTHNAAFVHQFTRPGTFYFWGGEVDLTYGMIGVVYVKPRHSHIEAIKVMVSNFEAEYRMNSTVVVASLPPMDNCSAQNATVVFCNENKPAINSDKFSFYFSECSTPIVSSVSPNLLTRIDEILLRGKGFSTRQCENIITFGKHLCVSKTQNSSHLTCSIDAQNSFSIGVQLPLRLLVDNRGYALIDIALQDTRSIVLLPYIDSISPLIGSIFGGTQLIIRGGGFKFENSSVQIIVGSDNCIIQSVNYTKVVCETVAGKASDFLVQLVVSKSEHKIPATCKVSSNCTFTYSGIITPNVTDVSPRNVSTNDIQFTIEGSGFGINPADISVTIGSTACLAINVSNSHIICQADYIGAGWNSLKVKRASIGNMDVGHLSVWSHPYISKVYPTFGSLHGGTVLTIRGNGFVKGRTSIKIGNKECNVLMTNQTHVQCSTQPNSMGIQLLDVTSNDQDYVPHIFIYATSHTPTIVSISPTTGKPGDILTIIGNRFINETGQNTVTIGNSDGCTIVAASANVLNCTLGHQTAGKYPVTVHVLGKGRTNTNIFFTYELSISSFNPATGSLFGGQRLTLQGNGFNVNQTKVMICSRECLSPTAAIQSDSTFICITPSLDESSTTQKCVVNVSVGHFHAISSQTYQYSASKTAQITRVYPARGGTRGGTNITITGTGFSSTKDDIEVSIDKANCTILTTSSTEIVCQTTRHLNSIAAKVDVTVKGAGLANNTFADFTYVDVWSSRSTWGNKDPPGEGEFVIITKGQKLLLDIDTPILKMLLIQGGTLEFEEKDIELNAENILITDGGSFLVGSEKKPFLHKAIITMHGHLRSKELPIYGTKTLAVREGLLGLYGKSLKHTWTHLAATANRGDNCILLKHAVSDWKVGDQIVIASTGGRHSQQENEMHTIAAISDDYRNLTLTEKLAYEHISEEEIIDGRKLEYRAEVGLLSRNVVVRGSVHNQWVEKIEACPDGFNTGEFATQTCFQGRFGEEMGSDQFGVQIMAHAPVRDKNLAIVRLSHVEVTHAGQAFRLGRYPVHFHLNGDMSESYVKGCAIHHTFNRAINIHGTHRVLVEHNVVYHIMGGAIFLEDGIETENIFQYNLAVFVKPSTSLRNDDVTPASFWVTNPNNIVRHNAAAGGSHFGYWYRMLSHPEGPSFTSQVCPPNVPLGIFSNNSAHSFGWFGLWTFPTFTPRENGRCNYWKDVRVVFEKLTAWNCQKGAETVDSGQLQMDDFVLVNNELAGFEGKVIVRGSQYTQDSMMVKNSLIVGGSSILKSKPTQRAIILPFGNGMIVQNITFVNFNNESAAIGLTSVDGHCVGLCGGFMYQTSGLQFINTPNKATFRWKDEMILHDLDGTLTGLANHKVVATTGLLPSSCTKGEDFSSLVPASICPPDVRFHRFAFNEIYPSNMKHRDLLVTNKHGNISAPYKFFAVTHKEGWMVLLINGLEHKISFLGASQVTNISYDASFYQFYNGDYILITQDKDSLPDRFTIDGKRTFISRSLKMPTYETSGTGDWFYNSEAKTMTYLVSYKARLSRSKRASLSGSKDRRIRFAAFRCFYLDCKPPKDPRLFPPATKRPNTFYLWSAKDTWGKVGKLLNSSTPARLPTDDDNVTIPEGLWVVVDVQLPRLNALHLYGQLEISNDLPKITLNVSYIYIRGGRLILGWEDDPYTGEAVIELRGTQSTPSFPINSGPNLGTSFIGVFGGLDLHGKKRMVPWTRVESTLKAGGKQLILQKAVDWKVGEEIVVATTGYNPWETETFRISAVSPDRKTLTLNTTAIHEHIAHNEAISGMTLLISAEVGLLTRNIKVVGSWYENMEREMFGARIIAGVTQTSIDSIYVGYMRVSNVEFMHTGQYGWATSSDARFSVAFHNLGTINHKLRPTYIKNCAFHHCFSSAIGIYGSNDLTFENNVIHRTIGSAIIAESDKIKIRNHLITLIVCPAVYILRFNLKGGIHWPAGIESVKGEDLEMTDNAVAGSERMGYHVIGEECDNSSKWSNNYVHGALLGVGQFPKDSVIAKKECVLYSGFHIYRCVDAGIYHNQVPGFKLENSIFAENGVSVCPIMIGPSAISHQTSSKTVAVKNTVFVGLTTSYNCNTDRLDKTNPNIALSKNARSGMDRWTIGLIWPTFSSGGNKAPDKPLFNIMSYPGISGLMTIENVTFAHFNHRCGDKMKTTALMTAGFNDDGQHPVTTRKIRKTDVKSTNFLFLQRPNVGKINSADCVDMDCDGLKKVLLVDEDGTFVGGPAPVSVFSQSEWQWNGDKRRGLGDYRIPKVMLTSLNGSRIPVDKLAPHKGIIRNPTCSYESSWQAYKCTDTRYAMMIVESLDKDTETRRLSPVALLGNGYLDLINGPQDHGWCSGYTCRKRISTFMILVELGKTYQLFFSSTSPQNLRLHLLNTDAKIVIAIYFSRPNRLDVYDYTKTYVPPKDKEGKTSFGIPNWTKYKPLLSDPDGTNYFHHDKQQLFVIVQGGRPVDIRMTPVVLIKFSLRSISEDEFFGEQLIRNLALFLEVPASKVRIVSVVSESSPSGNRKKRSTGGGVHITTQIGDPPATTITTNSSTISTTNDTSNSSSSTLSNNDLTRISSQLANAQQLNTLNQAINYTVSNMVLTPAAVPVSDPSWKNQNVVTSFQVKVPHSLNIVVSPEMSYEGGIFKIGPCLRFYDSSGVPLDVLGTPSDPWKLMAKLSFGSGSDLNAVLTGETEIDVKDGWANFTSLSISHKGTNYGLEFIVVFPAVSKFNATIAPNMVVLARPLALRLIPNPQVVTANQDVDLRVFLKDKVSGATLSNIRWRGHSWSASAELIMPFLYRGKVTNLEKLSLYDPSNNYLVFNKVSFSKAGIYILKIRMASTPNEYTINQELEVTVLPSTLITTTDTITSLIKLVVDIDYSKIEGGKGNYFRVLMVNYFMYNFPDVQFRDVAVSKSDNGKVNVHMEIYGETNAVISASKSICNMADSQASLMFQSEEAHIVFSTQVNGTRYLDSNCGDIHGRIIPQKPFPVEIIIGVTFAIVFLILATIIFLVWRFQIVPKAKIDDSGNYREEAPIEPVARMNPYKAAAM